MKFDIHQVKGKCQVCGRINHTSIWKVFIKCGWFRGDDEYIGKVCKNCKPKFLIDTESKLNSTHQRGIWQVKGGRYELHNRIRFSNIISDK